MTNKEIISSLRGLIGKYNLTDEEWQTVEKTIEVLSNSDGDCISRAEALKNLALTNSKDDVYRMINSLSSVQPNKWIPLKTRPMTEEETTFYRDWSEYGAEIFDCPLPDDGQEVLVSWGGMVCVDTFVKDCDGCYFEGVEIDDVIAWMPLPEAYKGDSE